MMTALYIILGLIAFIFIFHFVSMRVVKHVRRSRKYWNDEIFKNWNIRIIKGRFELYLTPSTSIMISKSRYHKINYDDDERKYSHSITLEIGGLWLRYEYGHNFLTDENWSEGERTKYYGLYSIDSELFWKTIWWGKHLYDNPFRRMKHVSTCVYDIDKNKFINRDDLDRHDHNQYFPYVDILEDTTYVDKTGKVGHVKEIRFWIEEMRWTFGLFRKLHLEWLFPKRRVYLEFETTGIGVEHDWKGQTTGSSIQLTGHELRLYNRVLKGKESKETFQIALNNRIREFMLTEKRF